LVRKEKMLKKLYLGQLYILTIFSPFLAACVLLRNRDSRLIILGGTFLFGVLGSLYIYIPGNDGHTHLQMVNMEYLDMSLVMFLNDLISLFSFQSVLSGVSDPYLHIMAYISGGIFGVPKLLHVFTSLIYGAIYFKSLTFVLKGIKFSQLKLALYILITIFLIYRGVTGLNSIRWWTALWMLFLGVVGYAETKNRKYILLGMLTPFVHFSFIAIGAPVLIAYFFRRSQKIIFTLWIVSFLIGASYNLIQPYLPALDVVTKKEQYVLNEENIAFSTENRTESNDNFYAKTGEQTFKKYSIVLLAGFLFYLNLLRPKSDDVFLIIFTAGIAMYTFGNLMEFSPSVSGRSRAGASVFIMAAAIRYFGVGLTQIKVSHSKKFVRFVNLVMISFFLMSIPLILFQISYVLNMLSVFTLFLAPLSWFMGDDDFAIREFLSVFI
jgi:hypothetical protein